MNKRQLSITAAVLLAILLVAFVAVIRSLNSASPSRAVSSSAVASSAPATRKTSLPPPAAGKTLRVGVYLSKMTGDRWGYSCQIVTELLRGNFNLVPILEA